METRRERLHDVVDDRDRIIESDTRPGKRAAMRAENIIYYLLGIFEALLVLRLVFKLLGANPDSAFVSGIYRITGSLIAPFTAIFPIASTDGTVVAGVLEPATIIAIIVYGLVAWAIAALISSATTN